MEHQGASSTRTYYRTFEVSCIYSGNTRKYSVTFEPNGKTIEQYRSKFMKEECDCPSCSQKRKDREKMINALKRDRAYKELSLLGE